MRPFTMRNSRIVTLAVLVVLALVIAGCSGGASSGNTQGGTNGGSGAASPAPTPASGPTISEKDFAFNPAESSVSVGDVVTFVNEDSAPHNVSIDGSELGMQNPGDSVTWTASKAGSFPYSCTIHPTMTGTITVK